MKIRYVEGDMFTPILACKEPILLPHVCNDIGAWGAGFVVPLAKHFPAAREEYIRWNKARNLGDHGDFALGNTQLVTVREEPTIIVCNMIAQHQTGGVRPLRYNSLVHCMEKVAYRSLKRMGDSIHCPMFGAGLAGGDWNFIEKLIEDIWLCRHISVTVYYLLNTLPSNWTPPKEDQ